MKKSELIFNNIAAISGLFFNWQVKKYRNILTETKNDLDFSTYKSTIDIGCGTGALCKVIQEYGGAVTGLDPSGAMLAIAKTKAGKAKPNEREIRFIQRDALNGLPFEDKSFDLAILRSLIPERARRCIFAELNKNRKG